VVEECSETTEDDVPYGLQRLFHLPEEKMCCMYCNTYVDLLPGSCLSSEGDEMVAAICLECLEDYREQEEEYVTNVTTTPIGFYLQTRKLRRFSGVDISYDERLGLPEDILIDWTWEYYSRFVHPVEATSPIIDCHYPTFQGTNLLPISLVC
jgi:hypothetical protein